MKKRNMVIIIIGIVIILIGIVIYLQFNSAKGNIDHVVRVINSENGHKREDIEHVFDLIEKSFNTKDYQDCVLKKIEYSHFSVNEKDIEDTYKDHYMADEIIYLNYEFKTGNKPSTGFARNEDYRYTAIFAKNDNTWILKNCGQGI